MPRISRNALETVVQLIDHIKTEIMAIRAEKDKLLADAQAKANVMEAKAMALESRVSSLPADLATLPEDAAARAWDWIKSLF